MKILYTSGEVHKAVKKIFAPQNSRRIAVVAYLGVNAESYLPSPKGIRIICCPEPGATSLESIRRLIKREAKVQFSDRLHTKVYWSDKGCIITSANISHRALGHSNQKEAGILIDSKDFDIDRLIHESAPYDVTQAVMNKLEKQDKKIRRAVGIKTDKNMQKGFTDWYESPYRETWKIGWWYDSELETAKSAIEKSLSEYNVSDPFNVLNVSKNQVTRHDWLLCFEITRSGIKKLEWMYVDFVVSVHNQDIGAYEEEYPFQAVQVHKPSQYPLPPFRITKEFKSAFKKAVQEYGAEKIESASTLKVNKKLLEYAVKNIS